MTSFFDYGPRTIKSIGTTTITNLVEIPLIPPENTAQPKRQPHPKIAYLNIRSLRNKTHFLELPNFITSNNIDVLTLSETWLNTSVKNLEIAIEGFKLFGLDRLHKRGGGVCTYIRQSIKASIIKDLSNVSDSNFHQLWIHLQYKKHKPATICVAYRHLTVLSIV